MLPDPSLWAMLPVLLPVLLVAAMGGALFGYDLGKHRHRRAAPSFTGPMPVPVSVLAPVPGPMPVLLHHSRPSLTLVCCLQESLVVSAACPLSSR